MTERYLLGLTRAERLFVLTAVRYYDEQIENDAMTSATERRMHQRLCRKVTDALPVSLAQITAYDRAAGNMLDYMDSHEIREHGLARAYGAREALLAAMSQPSRVPRG